MTSFAHSALSALTVEEIQAVRQILEDAGHLDEHSRFSFVTLREPLKADVLSGAPVRRRADAVVSSLRTLKSVEYVIDLDSRAVERTRVFEHAVDGGAPLFDEDYVRGAEIVKADTRFVDALRRRGVTDLDKVEVVILSAGAFYEDERHIRAARGVAYLMTHPRDFAWAHPIDGVVAHVDLTNERVLRVLETDITDVPEESGDYTDPNVTGPLRTSLKPISITQPEGVSFTLENGVLRWEGWEMQLGYNAREGLTLHQISIDADGERRPIVYRASVAEMVVNYGDPELTHNWQNYFDVGESRFGKWANSLELGCDCVGEIRYCDAVIADDFGHPLTIRNAICIHEEDAGILWKHSDLWQGSSETRRQRRLVVSFFVTVGNYDYGFYWYFTLDGAIRLEVKATGIVFTTGHRGDDHPQNMNIAPGLGAPIHQHLFSARIDTMIDGVANVVDEIDAHSVPMDPVNNPVGNAFARRTTRLESERGAVRDADMASGRVWRVSSAQRRNRMGHLTAYVLHPEGKPTLLAAPESVIRARAEFAAHHMWVTKFDEDEQWPAGLLVNQNQGGAGLPAYIADDAPIQNEDVVLWHTFGLTHFPRLEDYPIMPVDYAGFTFAPEGFFDRNPTLNVPLVDDHCAVDSGHGAVHGDHSDHTHHTGH